MGDCGLRHLAAPYTLGALDDAERVRFEAHVSGCAECAAEVDALRDSLLVLARAGAAESPPPPELRGRVLSAVAREARTAPAPAQPAEHGRRRRVALVLVPALAVAAAVAVLVVVLTGGSNQPPALRRIAPYSTVALRGAGGQRAGSVYVSLTGKAVALTSLPAAPAGKVYEAWVMVGGKVARAEPAGLFRGGRKQYVVLRRDVHPGDVVGFTLEPAGGSSRPTTQPLATASV